MELVNGFSNSLQCRFPDTATWDRKQSFSDNANSKNVRHQCGSSDCRDRSSCRFLSCNGSTAWTWRAGAGIGSCAKR
jgi:hypothetical protein